MSKHVLSLFAGVGGIDLGFERAGFKTVYANEFDKHARVTYQVNFPNVDLDPRDIREVEATDLPPNISVVTSGFPCQSFSIAGYRRGLEDERNGDLFFETLRIAKAVDANVLFLENVKHLVNHDGGKTFRIMMDALASNGYYVTYQVLNATEYGNVPQNRERIYIVAFKNKEHFERFYFPDPIPLTKTLRDFIDFKSTKDPTYYYTKENFNHYPYLREGMDNPSTLYQWRRTYVRKNMSGVCPTLTANMGTGGHNVPLLITDGGDYRKLTPRETFNLQGFPKEFVLPDIANGHLYKQAGNSVVVDVVERIARQIAKAMEGETDR